MSVELLGSKQVPSTPIITSMIKWGYILIDLTLHLYILLYLFMGGVLHYYRVEKAFSDF